MSGPQQVAVSFFNDPDINVKQGGRDLLVSHDFSSILGSVQSYKYDLSDDGLNSLQMLFADAADSPAPTVIIMGQTRQRIYIPPFFQGYIRLLASQLELDYTVTNFSAAKVNLHWLNIVPDGADTYVTQPYFGLSGTPLAASVTGANVGSNSVTFPAVAGRRIFVSSIAITGDGATAAAAVDATLTNVDNNGVAQTMHYAYNYAVGAGVPNVGLQISFSPPIAILPGLATVLNVPGAAGNTLTDISMNGFMI